MRISPNVAIFKPNHHHENSLYVVDTKATNEVILTLSLAFVTKVNEDSTYHTEGNVLLQNTNVWS